MTVREAKTVGLKYEVNKDASTTDIAKLVRADIKAAVKSGKLPSVKYSVKSSYYSMGSSISVRFSGVTPAYNPAYLLWVTENPHKSVTHYAPEAAKDRYSATVRAALDTLEKIVDAYNYDNSDSMTDYYDTNFAAHVTFESYGPGDATYDGELAAAKAMKVEADYITRELAANNPEIVKLVTEHVARDEAALYAMAVEAAAKNGIVPIPAPRHLTLVKPAPTDASHVAYLKHIGVD